MNGFIVNQTKVNMSLNTPVGVITADIVLGNGTRVENGNVTGSEGSHLVTFGAQNPTGFQVFFHQDNLTPEQRLSLHMEIETFITGAYQALAAPQGNTQNPSEKKEEEEENPEKKDAE